MCFLYLHSFFLLLVSVTHATWAPPGPIFELFTANKYIQPDGFNRSAVLAGPTLDSLSFPGPLILGEKGIVPLRVNVIDDLTDTTMLTSTSIHWHGIFQEGTSFADGAVGVTQCPIIPGNSFLYEFFVADQAGTFWYHSHHSNQYCDGLRGPLIIYDVNGPYNYLYDIDDENTIITLADWYHVASTLGSSSSPNSTLINGLGRFANGPDSPLAVINVVKGGRYRFRLISMSCSPNFVFSIDGHNMTIIEVDGNDVHPLVVDSIQIFAGQRYSFVLTADQPVNNYWIRALPNTPNATFADGLNSAILRYEGAPISDPTTSNNSISPLVETNLHPADKHGISILGAADVSLTLDVQFNTHDLRYTINNHSFAPPTSVPVLLQILSGASTAQELLPHGSVYVLPRNQVIEISIPGGGSHPVHLHGQRFAVIRSAGNSTYNFVNPVRRDVVNIGGPEDNVTIRFETNNEGPWILHCHINWHFNLGFAVVLAADVPAIADSPVSYNWTQLCPAYNASRLAEGGT